MGTPNRPVTGILDTSAITFDPGGIGARRAPTRAGPCADLLVAMRPGTFLALASPLPAPRPSLAWITAQLATGRSVSPPMLRVWLPPRPGGTPAVVAHDGRHRALALRAIMGEVLIPVQIELPTLDPDEEASSWAIAAMCSGMRAQGGARPVVPGPLFEVASDPAEIDALPPARPRRARGPPRKWAALGRPGQPLSLRLRRTGIRPRPLSSATPVTTTTTTALIPGGGWRSGACAVCAAEGRRSSPPPPGARRSAAEAGTYRPRPA